MSVYSLRARSIRLLSFLQSSQSGVRYSGSNRCACRAVRSWCWNTRPDPATHEAFLKAGGFRSSKDGQIYSNWEDVQLGMKLHRIGKVCYLPDLVVLTSARNLKLANARDILFGTPKKALRVQVMGKDL